MMVGMSRDATRRRILDTAERQFALHGFAGTSLREITRLRGEVRFVPPGSLPNDGKVIEDRRKVD